MTSETIPSKVSPSKVSSRKSAEKNTAKHPRLSELHFEKDDLRWATPEIVANYRAKRLKCNTIIDLGCGVGFQTFAFARRCKKVYAVEIDERKIKCARYNAGILKLANIEFILSDMLDPQVIEKIRKADIVFCDPERLPAEKERTLESIVPNVYKIIEVYSSFTPKIALEFPPQIRKIPFDAEKEYISVGGSLNRLTLYFGPLKKCERSAVMLPSRDRLENFSAAKLQKESRPQKAKELGTYLYEADPAVVKAGLLAELSEKTGILLYDAAKAVFFTSDKAVKSAFFCNSFKVIAECSFNYKNIQQQLQKHSLGKVVIRYSVPAHEYWALRKDYERNLKGSKIGYLFRFADNAVIADKLK